MTRARSEYIKSRDGDYRKLIEEENKKYEGAILEKKLEKVEENVVKNKPAMDYKAILQQRTTITRRDWGGDCFEYCEREIASSYKLQDLTQEQAAVICEIIKIPLSKGNIEQVPGGKLCPCGCGEMLRKGAKFRPGHDTRLRCRLIKEYKKTKSKAILKELRNWNWEGYLG